MANKIVHIAAATQAKPGLEVYRDFSMKSEPTSYPRPSRDDELKHLAGMIAEHNAECTYSEDKIVYEQLTDADRQQLYYYFELYEDFELSLSLWKANSRYKLKHDVNVQAIKNSLRNIFSWIPGERVINPEFGCSLYKYLYEGITDFNVEAIMTEIRGLVTQWEPRVTIDKVVNVATVDDTENNTVHLEIIYRIPSLSDEQYNYGLYYTKSQ